MCLPCMVVSTTPILPYTQNKPYIYMTAQQRENSREMGAEKIYILQSLLEVSNKLNVYGKLLI